MHYDNKNYYYYYYYYIRFKEMCTRVTDQVTVTDRVTDQVTASVAVPM